MTVKLLRQLVNSKRTGVIEEMVVLSEKKRLISYDSDIEIIIWNLESGEPISKIEEWCTGSLLGMIKQNDVFCFLSFEKKSIEFWNMETGAFESEYQNKYEIIENMIKINDSLLICNFKYKTQKLKFFVEC